ncbi:DUF1642 domain-containing protein [Pediococcus pentosaceus]|uniref:DUF1642 domain-containing protein n=1 Tax=Pediococcus pentosaceus TaxID=1255 RepID=UPI0023314452|nr:DUF1642 domain-containing protein [Pediococcus pentosaceus]MDB1561852.1 DUF1642 domain-containing protein [Pediococcus pentosaceus]
MTKEEVLEKLEEERESAKSKILYGQARNLSVKSYGWYFNGVNYAIDLVEKLDEPKKVVIPQFVADWIEKAKVYYGDEIDPLRIIDWVDDHVSSIGPHYEWMYNIDNQKLLLNAIANGYEVEKEKKYRVKLPGMIGSNGQQYISKSMDDKLFACAYRDYLEQEFTKEELEKFPNWVQQLEFEED